jgi:AraC-like DNA-binding protein
LVDYKFNALCHENENNYIFQLVKGRRLTGIYHSHDFYELICFLRGKGTQIVNDEKILTKEKSVMLLAPGDKHCFISQSDDIEIISLSVRRKEFERLSNVFEVSVEQCPFNFFFPQVSKLYDIYRENRLISESDCKLLLSTIFHAYVHAKEALSPDGIPDVLLSAAEEMKKIENLKKGISAFVTLSNYSQSHLARLVKKHFGMGLKQYINDLRLLRAYDDFIWTNESSEAISENLGFSSYSHFYRIFKERFSISPSVLRNGSKNKKY